MIFAGIGGQIGYAILRNKSDKNEKNINLIKRWKNSKSFNNRNNLTCFGCGSTGSKIVYSYTRFAIQGKMYGWMNVSCKECNWEDEQKVEYKISKKCKCFIPETTTKPLIGKNKK